MNIKAIAHIIRIVKQKTLPKLLIVLKLSVFLKFRKISIAIKPSIAKMIKTKAIIYITSDLFFHKSRSAIPHIKKAIDKIPAPMPVAAIQFGFLFLKQQNKGVTPIFNYIETDLVAV